MTAAASRVFHSLGFSESARGEWERPDRFRFFDDMPRTPSIPRGAGLSLTGASFGDRVRAVEMCRFDRILDFDPRAGTITVEAGITLGRLFTFLAPRGWLVAVQPGHPDITIGGCIAGNVHGKNPLAHGCFGRWVAALELAHPAHGRLTLSPENRPDLFDLTIGGFGLTGWILNATIRLLPLPGGPVRIEPVAVDSMEQAAAILAERRHEADLLYSWHDMAGSGRRGAGVIFVGSHLAEPKRAASLGRYKRLDQERRALPVGIMNRLGITAINRVQSFLWRGPKEQDAATATFPFARTPEYFYLYGRNGFIEHQVLMRWSVAEHYIAGLRRLLERHGVTPGLCVLKPFGGDQTLLRFEGEGLSLAIEVARGPAALALFADLDAQDAELGCRANLLKDARLPAAAVATQYPGLEEFRRRLIAFDPDRLMQSSLSQRIGL
ncbi:MAG: FAD-binding oxidoreductase [Magnetospirillum sp.]|nr:MAG: FAD-binding oxidoreductase [Magnetospirillum sp.]